MLNHIKYGLSINFFLFKLTGGGVRAGGFGGLPFGGATANVGDNSCNSTTLVVQ